MTRLRPLVLPLSFAALALACGPERAAVTPAPAETVHATLGRVERLSRPVEIEIAGAVEAERTTAVASRVVAPVTAVHAGLGARVRAGQPLLSIEPTAAAGQVAQAEGGLAQALAASSLAERNFARFEALAATAAASALELDAARTARDQALGAVREAEGALAAARAVAAESVVRAPYDGRVVRRSVEVGDLAAPGRTLVLLESERGRRLAVGVPERLAAAAALAPGRRVAVALDARPDLGRFEGELVELAPGPDPATHTITAKIDLGERDAAAGAAGRAWIAGLARDVVCAPASALVESGGLTLVVVRDGDGRAASRVVSVGERRPDGTVEILAGLAGGETVALGLARAPRAGSRIEAIVGEPR